MYKATYVEKKAKTPFSRIWQSRCRPLWSFFSCNSSAIFNCRASTPWADSLFPHVFLNHWYLESYKYLSCRNDLGIAGQLVSLANTCQMPLVHSNHCKHPQGTLWKKNKKTKGTLWCWRSCHSQDTPLGPQGWLYSPGLASVSDPRSWPQGPTSGQECDSCEVNQSSSCGSYL